MKKLIASLAVAFLMTAGLVAGTSTTASAGPYARTVDTVCNARATPPRIRLNQTPRVRVNVRPQMSNGDPRGPVRISFSSRDGRVTRNYQVFYDGAPETYSFARLPRAARYAVTVEFIGYDNAVFKSCVSSARLYVFNPR